MDRLPVRRTLISRATARAATRGIVVVALVAVVVAGCGSAPEKRISATSDTEVPTTSTTTSTTTTTVVDTTTTAAAPPITPKPAASAVAPTTRAPRRPRATTTVPPPAVPAPEVPFESAIQSIDESIAARMHASWRVGCPVGLDQLRLVTVSHWDFKGAPRLGEVVVHADHAGSIVEVFRALFKARFPIDQMRLVDEFGGDDDKSMAANNTSAFNCRAATGSSRWSEHSYGWAIDINPVQNPYVTSSGTVLPPAGKAYRNRSSGALGMITAGGPVVKAFANIGWGWGGNWSSVKDYQHFSATGR